MGLEGYDWEGSGDRPCPVCGEQADIRVRSRSDLANQYAIPGGADQHVHDDVIYVHLG